MDTFIWITLPFLLIPVFQFTAVTGLNLLYITVRDGGEVTLSCEGVTTDQDECDRTTWLFNPSENTAAVELINLGKIGRKVGSKSDRLSVTATCSLVIKKVTVEDVGLYTCRQFISGKQQGPDSQVDLSVVTMTEHEDADKRELTCSVSTYGQCRHTVKWVNQGRDVNQHNKDLIISESTCSATVSLFTSQFIICNVTDLNSGKVQLFNFNPSNPSKPSGWWWSIIVAVALLLTVVVLIRWKMTKANKTQTDNNIVDPEDGVSYASISFPNVTSSEDLIRGRENVATYSTVNVSSSFAGISNN
ncbi:hypothetical protein PAMA_007290 [Pampus argenteus]